MNISKLIEVEIFKSPQMLQKFGMILDNFASVQENRVAGKTCIYIKIKFGHNF